MSFNSQLNPEGVFLVARSLSKHFVPNCSSYVRPPIYRTAGTIDIRDFQMLERRRQVKRDINCSI